MVTLHSMMTRMSWTFRDEDGHFIDVITRVMNSENLDKPVSVQSLEGDAVYQNFAAFEAKEPEMAKVIKEWPNHEN